MRNSPDYREGLAAGLPVILGYLPVGFAFGVTAAASGIPPWIVVLISLTNFTSAGQLMGATLIVAGASIVEIGITTLIINIRYIIMAMSFSQRIDPGMPIMKKMLSAMAITDELFAIASLKKGEIRFGYVAGLVTGPYAAWSLGTLLGAYVTGLLPAAIQSSMGIALYAMFIALILPAARSSRAFALVAGAAALLSGLLSYVPLFEGISSGYVIILCTIAAAAAGAWLFPVGEVRR